MQPVTPRSAGFGAARAKPARPDPAPSPLRYRLSRLWRRRWVRRLATQQGPALVFAALAVWLASDRATHAFVTRQFETARASLAAQPHVAIRQVIVEGASPALTAEIRAALGDLEGASSLTLDPVALRARVEALPRVHGARVAVEAPDALRVNVTERLPAALWRIGGRLRLIDVEGADLGPAGLRADHPHLPLLLGVGADAAAAEGLALLSMAGPLASRVRGLVRVGARRWDLALDRDVTIRLPMENPEAALAVALAMHAQTRILDRDVRALDLRLPDRPTLRLGPAAAEALAARRKASRPGEDA